MKLITISLLIIVNMLSSAISKEKVIPIKDFFEKPLIDGIRISPDGKHLAARMTLGGSKNLVILERETNKQVYKFNFSDDKNEVGTFGWLNNERIYARMQTKVGPLELPAQTGYLFAANYNGKKKIKLLPKKRTGRASDVPVSFSVLDFLENDPQHILIQMADYNSTQRSVHKLNVYSSKRTRVEKGRFGRNSFNIDHDANVRILQSWNKDYTVKTLYYREDESKAWTEIDSRNREESTLGFIAFTPDNRQFYVYESSKERTSGIYLVNPNDKEFKLVHRVAGDQSIERYIFDDEHNQLIGIVREKGTLTKEYFEGMEEVSKYHKDLDKAFPNQFVRILNTTNDLNTSMLFVQSDRNAGQFFLFDKKTNSVTYLMGVRTKLSAKKMAERRPVSFTARDGLEIRGILTLPNGPKKNLPMVVLVHGGPYGIADKWVFESESQFLASRGYAVFQVNYRGSGGRGLNFQYDYYREMGTSMQDDLTDATLWAVEQGYADKNRLCIYGASYGGYAALMGAVKEPDLYKCAIGYAGVYDIEVQATKSDTRNRDSGRQFLNEAWNAYDDDFVRKNSSVFHVDKLKADIMLVHGTHDRRTPIENYYRMSEALDRINYPYERLVKEDEGHGFYTEKNQIELYTKMEKFLFKSIGE